MDSYNKAQWLGSDDGSKASPVTSAPSACSHMHNQLPLKPV
jgi:hypothetical protein